MVKWMCMPTESPEAHLLEVDKASSASWRPAFQNRRQNEPSTTAEGRRGWLLENALKLSVMD